MFFLRCNPTGAPAPAGDGLAGLSDVEIAGELYVGVQAVIRACDSGFVAPAR